MVFRFLGFVMFTGDICQTVLPANSNRSSDSTGFQEVRRIAIPSQSSGSWNFGRLGIAMRQWVFSRPWRACQEGCSQHCHHDVLRLGGAVFLYSSSYS
jgi:hypothetical protein